MEYLVDCVCGHDLTRHGDDGCHGKDFACSCTRSRLSALDSAIESARIHPWSVSTR